MGQLSLVSARASRLWQPEACADVARLGTLRICLASGYDFGYLLKVVTCSPLPSQEADFFALLRLWFPCVYDIKYLMRSCKTLKGGLQDVADDLGVSRIGQQHQAGSDSLLTANTFFKLRDVYFDGVIDDSKYL